MKRKFLKLLGILFIVFFSFINVNAVEVAEANESVKQEGEYNSTRFVAGNRVTSNANINGISFVAGNNVTLSGRTSYGFYAGNSIEVNENVENDLFIAGNNISIGQEAYVGRDAYIAGAMIDINSNVTRDLRVAGGTLDLSGVVVGGDVYAYVDELKVDENTIIEGKLTYTNETKLLNSLESASIGSTEVIVLENNKEREYTLLDHVLDFLVESAAAFLTIVVLFYFFPNTVNRLNKVELKASTIAKTAVNGFIVLIVVPVIVVLGFFTGVLIPLSLIGAALYAISLYLSSIFVYYIIGKVVGNKVFKKNIVYLSLVCGILLVKLIELIPILGGLISAVILFYGLGLMYAFVSSKREK